MMKRVAAKRRVFVYVQQMGRSLMVPIAVLPAASILVRIGDMQVDTPWLAAIVSVCKLGGNAIFNHLPIFFAIGIAIGLTGGSGIAALAAAVGYFVFSDVITFFEASAAAKLDTGVLGGMLCGAITTIMYKRFHQIKLPDALGFFGGKRFVPIATSLVMVIVGLAVGAVWPGIQSYIKEFGIWMTQQGAWGAGIYGFINRMLIPTGLHHILNHIAWFQLGEYAAANGNVVNGDLWRYYAGDPTAGMYMTGFFPVMMFGLQGYALAFVHAAHSQNRKRIASVMLTAALTSFLTGITEPLEFAFMLTVPLLYGIHALYTGLSMIITSLLHMRAGFGFSAGFIDLIITWQNGQNQWILLLLGLCYFALYYGTAMLCIRLFNLQTPGREELEPLPSAVISPNAARTSGSILDQLLVHVGGITNIVDVDACITRLRLHIRNDKLINEAALMQIGAYGLMRISSHHIHIIMGTDSDELRDKIEQMLTAQTARQA
ncbi:PTS transporter subunit EIIC [Paenibacillus marinisediminis]